jgi:tripartite ATP-independent transporter DctP family solute receptor
MKKIFTAALSALAVIFSSGALSAAPVTIKLAHVGSTEHQYHIGAEEFKRLVEERSNKEITVNIFPQSQLGNERDAIEGVRMGTIEMTTIAAAGALPSFAPEIGVLGVPYILKNHKQAYAVLDGPFGDELGKYIEAKGMINLCFWEMGFRNFTNNVRPIRTPADVRDLKIRVQESKSWMELIKLLGGIPTPIAFGELYSALQQKVVDGQENPIATIYSMRYYEVQKHLTLDGHTYEATAVLVNPKFFSGLSDAHREIVRQAAIDARTFQRARLAEIDKERLEVIKNAGVEIVTDPDLSAFQKATEDLYKQLDGVPAELVQKFKDASAAAE